MKVKNIIKLLVNTYHQEDELMIDWVDIGQFDEFWDDKWHYLDTEVWNKAVASMEAQSAAMTDMHYVSEIVDQAKKEVSEELS